MQKRKNDEGKSDVCVVGERDTQVDTTPLKKRQPQCGPTHGPSRRAGSAWAFVHPQEHAGEGEGVCGRASPPCPMRRLRRPSLDTDQPQPPHSTITAAASSATPHTHTPPPSRRSLLSGAAAVAAATAAAAATPRPARAVTAEQLVFLEAWRAVDRAYVDKGFNGQAWFRVREKFLKDVPMRDRAETYTAIRTLLSSLGDPFTRLLDPARAAAMNSGRAGSVVGVGVEVAYAKRGSGKGKDGKDSVVVVAPAPGAPAARAGVRAGDGVISVDGHELAGLSLAEVGELLTGEAGSVVSGGVCVGGKGKTAVVLINTHFLTVL